MSTRKTQRTSGAKRSRGSKAGRGKRSASNASKPSTGRITVHRHTRSRPSSVGRGARLRLFRTAGLTFTREYETGIDELRLICVVRGRRPISSALGSYISTKLTHYCHKLSLGFRNPQWLSSASGAHFSSKKRARG